MRGAESCKTLPVPHLRTKQLATQCTRVAWLAFIDQWIRIGVARAMVVSEAEPKELINIILMGSLVLLR